MSACVFCGADAAAGGLACLVCSVLRRRRVRDLGRAALLAWAPTRGGGDPPPELPPEEGAR